MVLEADADEHETVNLVNNQTPKEWLEHGSAHVGLLRSGKCFDGR